MKKASTPALLRLADADHDGSCPGHLALRVDQTHQAIATWTLQDSIFAPVPLLGPVSVLAAVVPIAKYIQHAGSTEPTIEC